MVGSGGVLLVVSEAAGGCAGDVGCGFIAGTRGLRQIG
jgi:hypothetical protein